VAACKHGPSGGDDPHARTYAANRDQVYHATIDALIVKGYTVFETDPVGGIVQARSEATPGGQVRLTRATIKPDPQGGTRLQLSMVWADAGASDGSGEVKQQEPYVTLLDYVQQNVGK